MSIVDTNCIPACFICVNGHARRQAGLLRVIRMRMRRLVTIWIQFLALGRPAISR